MMTSKKADMVKHPRALDHVGILVIGPSGETGLPFI
jgi:hypothetical protein